MSSVSSTSLAGMGVAQDRLSASAHNVANLGTEGFRRQQVVATASAPAGVTASVATAAEPGASLESDVVEQLGARNAFLANLAVFKTHDRMLGALLDDHG